MIQCWRSRDENRNYCSRVCCPQALKNALLLKKRRPDLPVVVLYRDIMTPGFMEEYYTRAREAGVLFVPYTQDDKPRVEFEDGRPRLTYTDPILAAPVAMDPDLLVLSIGLEPGEAEETAEVFGVELDQDGFFREAESKWRPVDSLKQGVFYCGVARAPGGLRDTVASAKAAAQRALRILSETRLAGSRVTARVRHSLCSRCGRCIEVCPYGARRLDMRSGTVVVDDLLCQGCGSCAAVCPNSASFVRGFTDRQVMGTIDAALAQGRGETCK
jgi:heterodisulfide reductase subunit A